MLQAEGKRLLGNERGGEDHAENINDFIDYSLEEVTTDEVPHEAIRIARILGIDPEILRRIERNEELKNNQWRQPYGTAYMNDMKSKLGIDFNQVEHARSVARKIADGGAGFCGRLYDGSRRADAVPSDRHRRRGCQRGTAAERGGGRAAGEKRTGRRRLFFLGNAIVETGLTPQQIAEEIAAGKLDITRSAVCTAAEREAALKPYIDASIAKIAANRQRRENYIATIGEGPRPYLYVIVATGNIYEDVVQAQAAARQGADIIAVIRTTGQSLLDYVPYGATTEGFGGTFATQENFRIMRKALDEVGEEVGRYIRLCNYCSGLCMPEIAVMGALRVWM